MLDGDVARLGLHHQEIAHTLWESGAYAVRLEIHQVVVVRAMLDALFHCHQVTQAEVSTVEMHFTDALGPVSGLYERPHQRRKFGDGTGKGAVGDVVGSRYALTGDEAHAGGDAHGSRGDGLPESHARSGQGIEVRRPDFRVARAAERVEALLVGHEDQEVHGAVLSW